MSGWNEKIIERFRSSGGKVGGMFEGVPLLLLTSVGARTGRRHTTPLTYLRDGEGLYVFGTNAGADRHPAWFHNVQAGTRVHVELGVEAFPVKAEIVTGDERDRLFARQTEVSSAFADYEAGTSRIIPVIALHREPGAGDRLIGIHADMRRDLNELLTDLGSAGTLTARLRARCRTSCGSIHEHHVNESTRGFPLLVERFPEMAPVLADLAEEHDRLAGAREDLERRVAAAGDPAALYAEFSALIAELEAHFAREEDLLVRPLNLL